jgi:hypothetical protein
VGWDTILRGLSVPCFHQPVVLDAPAADKWQKLEWGTIVLVTFAYVHCFSRAWVLQPILLQKLPCLSVAATCTPGGMGTSLTGPGVGHCGSSTPLSPTSRPPEAARIVTTHAEAE